MKKPWLEAISALKSGWLAVIPTDTIYGIVARAEDEATIKKLNQAKKRADNHPYIILISALSDLKIFDIKLTAKNKNILAQVWPGAVSIILPTKSKRFKYLSPESNLAFRLPAMGQLRDLLNVTGPLVAPSANISGQPPAKTIAQAQKYFSTQVAVYVRAETEPLDSLPSTLLDLSGAKPKIKRRGSVNLDQFL
ncbi:MAG: threonylcarbamoyl-AMP synthase [Candidatus Vogelbacteria bacterium RIFOXYD1_FULL_44_32]|uniref:L-threonylcarbamoyladenylate synthase n=1 Tax=Candidatus Vogelbacteria bacterium RIFOXYD1_FULL_44_32 TaxID=1802438 RepID=A0A1G2QCZ4_9BACT|nr:MAG: threonylcarbamoyl-AMP synthase [Candidatus Vogelbacteria bacterium RIFOXYD1_FULL_44_32]